MKKLHEQKSILDPDLYSKIILEESKKAPDPKKHQVISFIKSAVRIAGYFILPFNLTIAAIVLILSEVIGIIEELV